MRRKAGREPLAAFSPPRRLLPRLSPGTNPWGKDRSRAAATPRISGCLQPDSVDWALGSLRDYFCLFFFFFLFVRNHRFHSNPRASHGNPGSAAWELVRRLAVPRVPGPATPRRLPGSLGGDVGLRRGAGSLGNVGAWSLWLGTRRELPKMHPWGGRGGKKCGEGSSGRI